MARLRLFGPAAEAAGTRVDDCPGEDLAKVLAAAAARYGADFAEVLATSRIWVNGIPPGGGAIRLAPDDEVAVLPPVSGG